MVRGKQRCGAWRNIWNARRVCSYERGHETGHEWEVNPPQKPPMPPREAGEQAQEDWWWWQVTWFMEDSQLGQHPYNMDSFSHRSAAERDLIDELHEEAERENSHRLIAMP